MIRHSRRRLGEILHAEGVITSAQLERALEAHRSTGQRLGDVLVDMGAAGEEHVASVLSRQVGAPFVRLTGRHIAEDVLQLIPVKDAVRLQVIPIEAAEGQMTLAMVDPLDILALDEVRRLTRKDVRIVVTTLKDFRSALGQYGRDDDRVVAVLAELPAPVPFEEPASLRALRQAAERQPVIRLVNQLIESAVRDRATDIHLEPQGRRIRVRYRVDGVLRQYLTLPGHVLPQMVSRIKIMAGMDIAERRVPQDGSFQVRVAGRTIDIRVSTVPSLLGEKAVLRVLDRSTSIDDLDALQFTDANLAMLHRIISRPQGVFLLTGPTGSGKTTTLYAILNRLNREDVNILTIEDPVEYQIAGITQVAVHIRAGVTFTSALRHFLRQDPDIVMVGEIRDVETARIAVQAALTGHLVLSTMHTGDAMGAVTRLLEMNIAPYLVAASLSGVAAQRLVRVLCPRCKRPDPLSREEILMRFGEDAPLAEFLGPTGCEFCDGTGYRGRVAIVEVAELSEGLRHLIINHQPAHILRERAMAEGMTSIQADGLRKAAAGLTSLAEVERVVSIERPVGAE